MLNSKKIVLSNSRIKIIFLANKSKAKLPMLFILHNIFLLKIDKTAKILAIYM